MSGKEKEREEGGGVSVHKEEREGRETLRETGERERVRGDIYKQRRRRREDGGRDA